MKTHSKIYSLTGHGQVRRKQVAEDGKSLRSRKSFSEDPFASRPGSSGKTRTPTSLETRLNEEMTLDEKAEHIPDLPSQNYVDELHRPQPRRPRNSDSLFIPHHDDILSSSPIAQSTPRIRLEPAYQGDGRTTLRNVPAESPSMFDQDNSSVVNNSEMEIDSPPAIQVRSRRRSGGRRRSVQARDSYVSTRPYARVKKHPSPSKAELERLGKALDMQLGRGSFNEDDKGDDDVAMGGTDYRPRPTPGILANLDTNTRLPEPTRRDQRSGFGLFLKPEMTRTAATMPDIGQPNPSQNSRPESFTSRFGRGYRGERRLSRPNNTENESLMDIDELQGNQTALMRS